MSTNRPQSNSEESPSPLLDVTPPEVRDGNLYTHFSIKDLGVFAQTSKQAEQETAFLRLLAAAVNAIPESLRGEGQETRLAAIAILKKHPELLFRKGIVTDHFGRKIWASPYQIFLGAGDVWALKQVHDEIIPLIQDGETQAKAQFQAQFPNCPWPFDPRLSEEALYDDRNKAQIAEVIAQLKTIVEKLTADPCTHDQATLAETTEAVAKLCQIFAPKDGEIIQTGLHFPLAILREIYNVYHAQYGHWTGAQLSFFSLTVIGGAEAALTAVDGQCVKKVYDEQFDHCTDAQLSFFSFAVRCGAEAALMDKGPDRRDGLFCPHPKGIPEKLAPLVGKLGSAMYVDPCDGLSCFVSSTLGSYDWYNQNAEPTRGRRAAVGVIGAIWTTYGEQKQKHMRAIMRPLFDASTNRLDHPEQPKRCVIL